MTEPVPWLFQFRAGGHNGAMDGRRVELVTHRGLHVAEHRGLCGIDRPAVRHPNSRRRTVGWNLERQVGLGEERIPAIANGPEGITLRHVHHLVSDGGDRFDSGEARSQLDAWLADPRAVRTSDNAAAGPVRPPPGRDAAIEGDDAESDQERRSRAKVRSQRQECFAPSVSTKPARR